MYKTINGTCAHNQIKNISKSDSGKTFSVGVTLIQIVTVGGVIILVPRCEISSRKTVYNNNIQLMYTLHYGFVCLTVSVFVAHDPRRFATTPSVYPTVWRCASGAASIACNTRTIYCSILVSTVDLFFINTHFYSDIRLYFICFFLLFLLLRTFFHFDIFLLNFTLPLYRFSFAFHLFIYFFVWSWVFIFPWKLCKSKHELPL